MGARLTMVEINEAREAVDSAIHKLTTEINTRIAERNRLNAERLRLSDLATKYLADELRQLRETKTTGDNHAQD